MSYMEEMATSCYNVMKESLLYCHCAIALVLKTNGLLCEIESISLLLFKGAQRSSPLIEYYYLYTKKDFHKKV